jgi:4-aminobutyrate aminotransferase-like enzyme
MLNHKELQDLRDKYLGPSLRLSYDEPLHIVRGEGQYLFDAGGNQYLDCVNNEQHVGHCHPRVVAAARKQYGKLNANTRYLSNTVVRYAKNLIDTLPDRLDVCFFTNSGSESNDLALRLTRHFTGSKETIVFGAAYHGHLSSLIEISPYKHVGPGGSGPPDFVYTVPAPDPFRGKYRGPDCTNDYVQEVQRIIARINGKGLRVSAFIAEAIMGCGGQLLIPKGLLKGAFELVKKADGVCIADEVQIGFGRIGSHFWGFEHCGVVPDIVTMGKPMGNGHPLSAVVTTREIADTFNNEMEYFNSFGGNPVSCAVGQAVLDVIKDDELQENAPHVGSHLLDQLNTLRSKHDLIGDVRGAGLFIGVELVDGRCSLDPAGNEADVLINMMKEKGFLLSSEGPDHNVIKIKPPMVFTKANADLLVKTLDESM